MRPPAQKHKHEGMVREEAPRYRHPHLHLNAPRPFPDTL
jgi:hypothetical protein